MITDKQVDAALQAWLSCESHCDAVAIRAALEAADLAAWSTDMESAPHQTVVLLWSPSRFARPEGEFEVDCYSTGETVGSYSSMSLHGTAKAWRHLPKPPK